MHYDVLADLYHSLTFLWVKITFASGYELINSGAKQTAGTSQTAWSEDVSQNYRPLDLGRGESSSTSQCPKSLSNSTIPKGFPIPWYFASKASSHISQSFGFSKAAAYP
jgi:hypothetical protein